MGKEIARRWKSLQSDEAQKFHKMAANDLVRYRKELEEYQSKKSTHKVVAGARPTERAPNNLKPAPQLQVDQDGTWGSVSSYRESNLRLREPLPSMYDSISSSGYAASSNSLGHRDLATESALAQLFAQDGSTAFVNRSTFENSGHSVTDRGTLGHQLISQYPLLANALGRPGLDRDYVTSLGGWDPTAALRDNPSQGYSFTEQLLLGNLMGRSGAESFNAGAMPWNNSLFNMTSVNADSAITQQRALEQHELLQLLSGSTSLSTSSLLDRSSNPLGLPSPSFLSAGPSSQSSSERDFLASNDALALQRLLLLRHQQERDLQAAMAARNANDDILVRRLLGAARDDLDGQNSARPGPRSRQPDRSGGGRDSSGGSWSRTAHRIVW
jgi:hypothetical protein